MGGTWDATNLISSDVAVITPIGLDHPELGATLTEIAGEKAGIIKDGKAVVVREQEAEAARRARVDDADEVGASLLHEFARLGGRRTAARRRRSVVPAARPHALPTRICSCRCSASTPSQRGGRRRGVRVAVRRGPRRGRSRGARGRAVARAVSRSSAGSRRRRSTARTTPPGPRRSRSRFGEFFLWDRLHLVLAVSENKDVAGIVARSPRSPTWSTRRATRASATGDATPIAEAVGVEGTPVTVHGSVAEALDAARAAASPGDLICVTGSLFTVADAAGRSA